MCYAMFCKKVRPDSFGAFCFLGPCSPHEFSAPQRASVSPVALTFHRKQRPENPFCAAVSQKRGAEMPAYQNVTPPISLMPGDVGFSFNNEAFPGSAQAGSQFAIPSYAGQPDTGTAVR